MVKKETMKIKPLKGIIWWWQYFWCRIKCDGRRELVKDDGNLNSVNCISLLRLNLLLE